MKLPRWIHPPDLGDEELTSRALLLHVLLWALVAVPIPVVAYNVWFDPANLPRALVQAGVGETANVLLLWLLHSGRVRLASIGQVTAFFLFMTVTAATGEGPSGQAYQMGYVITIVIAGLLLGVRGAVVVAVASVGVGVVLVATGTSGSSVPRPGQVVAVSAVLYPVIAVVQYLGQRQLRRALRRATENEARLRALYDATFEGIMTHDRGVIVSANATFARLFGYDAPEQLVGVNGFHSLLTPESAARMREGMATGGAEPARFVGVRRDGSNFQGETQSRTISIDGRPVRVVAARDVTARIEAEAEREALHDRLAKVERLETVGRLAGGVAHDFNNLLTVTIGSLSMVLEERSLPAEQREHVRVALDAAERGAQLTGQLLAIGRRERYRVEALDLSELVTRLRPVLERAVGPGVKLELELPHATADVTADPGQVERVLVNLCLNARDAMPDGGRVRISVAPRPVSAEELGRVPDAAPGRYVELAVVDTGTGMTQDVLAHVFEPFFTTKPAGKGTGLGLSSIYGIVRQHGGFITVSSKEGRGTAFRVFWPARM